MEQQGAAVNWSPKCGQVPRNVAVGMYLGYIWSCLRYLIPPVVLFLQEHSLLALPELEQPRCSSLGCPMALQSMGSSAQGLGGTDQPGTEDIAKRAFKIMK